MSQFGLDSTSPVSVGAHRGVGSTVALRYLSRSTDKVVTAAEHAAYKAAGIDLCLVFEDGAKNALLGYNQGVADAVFARDQALSRLGTPPRPPQIPFAVDFDTAGHPERTDPYFDGVASVLGKDNSGGYGSAELVAHLAQRGFKVNWQTYAWSAGRFVAGIRVFQFSNGHVVGGVGVDYNHVYPDAAGDFGQWDFRSLPLPLPPGVDPMSLALEVKPDGNIVLACEATAPTGHCGEVFLAWSAEPGNADSGPVMHGIPGKTPHAWISLGTPGT